MLRFLNRQRHATELSLQSCSLHSPCDSARLTELNKRTCLKQAVTPQGKGSRSSIHILRNLQREGLVEPIRVFGRRKGTSVKNTARRIVLLRANSIVAACNREDNVNINASYEGWLKPAISVNRCTVGLEHSQTQGVEQ